MPTETVNIVQLLCDLSELSDEVFHASKMGPERRYGCNIWSGWGRLNQGHGLKLWLATLAMPIIQQ